MEHMRIHHPRDLPQGAGDLRGEFEGRAGILSGNPYVDGRRLSEIQHLIDDVGGLEEELHFGEFSRQQPSQAQPSLAPVFIPGYRR